jgi:ABC-type antimicrobial peptide transport system permease subunit
VGATRRDIFTQLLIETVLIAAGSGLVGLLLSVAAVALLTVAFPTLPAPQLDLRQPLLALAPILLSGVLAGAYPALLAARLAPGAALRRA